MKFDLWSDFHVEKNPEFDWDAWNPTSKILVLAGDTSDSVPKTLDVVKNALNRYDRVIFLEGNHEYYESHNVSETRLSLERSKPDRSTYLWGPTYYAVDDVAFIGNMGWYSWDYPGFGTVGQQAQRWMQNLNDVKYIQFGGDDPDGALPRDKAERHAREIHMRLGYMRKHHKRIVVVTHTVPNMKGMVGPTHPLAPLNGCFFNSFMVPVWMDNELKPDIWCFGHTHFPQDFVQNDVRFVCNPRGRTVENSGNRLRPICIDTEDERVYK